MHFDMKTKSLAMTDLKVTLLIHLRPFQVLGLSAVFQLGVYCVSMLFSSLLYVTFDVRRESKPVYLA